MNHSPQPKIFNAKWLGEKSRPVGQFQPVEVF